MYHFVMYGNEGLEGYTVVESIAEISSQTIANMELRARYNSQRNISGYAFKADVQIPPECIDQDFLTEKAIKIF